MPKILIVQYPGWKAHISGDHNFWTAHEQVIKFSGFSFLDKYIHLTKIQQNPWGSGGKFFKIQVILHGMTLLFFILGKLFPFYHQPKKLKIEKKKKKWKKKISQGNIILHKCTKNHDHILRHGTRQK